MKKNSLELKKRQHQMLIEQERKDREKRERKAAAKQEKLQESGEVAMKNAKFCRGRILPRREYKAQRRQAKLVKYAPRVTSSDGGDIDMDRPKRITPVSKTLRLVKDKESISKH